MPTCCCTLFLLEGVAAEEVDLVVGVYFISFVMVRSWLLCFVLCLLINKNGCVHHNDAEAGGFNLLFEKNGCALGRRDTFLLNSYVQGYFF